MATCRIWPHIWTPIVELRFTFNVTLLPITWLVSLFRYELYRKISRAWNQLLNYCYNL